MTDPDVQGARPANVERIISSGGFRQPILVLLDWVRESAARVARQLGVTQRHAASKCSSTSCATP